MSHTSQPQPTFAGWGFLAMSRINLEELIFSHTFYVNLKKTKERPPLCNLQKGGRLVGLECYKRTCVICGLVDLILVVFEGLFESVPDAVQHAAIKIVPPFDDRVFFDCRHEDLLLWLAECRPRNADQVAPPVKILRKSKLRQGGIFLEFVQKLFR